MRGGVKNEYFGIELQEIKVEELNIDHFKLPILLLSFFNIKYIGLIPYLFLYSNERGFFLKNKNDFIEYEKYYKFAISNNCDIFMYKNGEIKLLNMNYEQLAENRLFDLLNINSLFLGANYKTLAEGKILDMIKKVYPDLKDIIRCLENLYLMYKINEKNKKNKNYKQYSRNRPPNEI